MAEGSAEVVVAGHICFDIYPEIGRKGGADTLLVPGKLVEIGPALTSTGGSVSNTGIALHKLGVQTSLIGKVGDDSFGHAVLDIVRRQDPVLAEDMIVSEGDSTSYSIVINLPDLDRTFWHCAGANDTFGAEDVAYDKLKGVRIFHFGYPPLMRALYSDGGDQLTSIFQRVKEQGVTTSLDMARPDPDSDSGRVAWKEILQKALPYVDVFLPSIEEILFMMDRTRYDEIEKEVGPSDIISEVNSELLRELAGALLDMGPAVVGIKLGDQGMYMRTTADAARISAMGAAAPEDTDAWKDRELLASCFKVDLVGATGSGDCTVAGFLAGLVRGMGPEEVMTAAVAVGACNVEKMDATSGVTAWEIVQERIGSGWERCPVDILLSGGSWDNTKGVWDGGGR